MLDREHPEIARCVIGLGILLLDRGRPEEAEPLLKEGLDISKKKDMLALFPEAENAFALTEAILGRPQDTEPLLLSSYKKLIELEGARNSKTKNARLRLYRFYENRHQPEKAKQYRLSN